LFGGSGGPTRAQVQSLVAQGEGPAARYTGADIPEQLKNVPLWLVAERHAGTNTLALVAYTTGGHPCLGSIDTSRLQSQPITAFEGSCSESDMIGKLSSYGPFGRMDQRGPDALLYDVVPADVRIVEAHATHGALSTRFAATVAMPDDPKERFFIFDSPGGATHSLDVDLTFYDRSGQGIGSRHVSLPSFMGASSGSEPPCTPANHCAQASASTAPRPK
jgi:hypothetical protein